jgi:hypothetical protein
MHFYAKIDLMKAGVWYFFLLYVEILHPDLVQKLENPGTRYC